MFALHSNTTGISNTADGAGALQANTTGDDNTATGISALEKNTGGRFNTGTGASALDSNTLGNSNTATGLNALFFNTTGSNNTAHGVNALLNNTTAANNSAMGMFALQNNTIGHDNSALGFQALNKSTTGNNNVALGMNAGANLTTGSNNIDIGNPGVAGEAGKIRIGKQGTQNGTFIAGIAGVAVTGSPVVVNASGKLGVGGTSSARFKKGIQPMDKASEAILALKPVTFRYKEEIDPDGIPQFGLIAEQVEKVNPDLITRDEDGKPTTVRYEAVNAMLLNEFLKEHHRVQELEKDLRTTIAQQQKQIEALTSGLQKVTGQLTLSKTALKLADNKQ